MRSSDIRAGRIENLFRKLGKNIASSPPFTWRRDSVSSDAGQLVPTPKNSSIEELRDPCQFSREELVDMVRSHSREQLREIFRDDPFLSNFVVNHWELAHGEAVLTTYPWMVVVPISDVCNAECSFCNSWLRGQRLLDLSEIDRFEPVIRHAATLGLEGHGEPLVHPRFEEIVRKLKGMIDPRCRTYIITNAFHLDKYFERLLSLGVTMYNISLNAATPETHDKVMGLGKNAFERITASIRRLAQYKREQDPGNRIGINLTLVVTSESIHEVADFVRLANEIGASQITLRTLLPTDTKIPGLNYHLLPPYLHPDFEAHRAEAIKAIKKSNVPVEANVESWSAPVLTNRLLQEISVTPPRILAKAEARTSPELEQVRPDLKRLEGIKTRGEPRADGTYELLSMGTDENAPDPYGRKAWYQCFDVYGIFHMNDFFFLLRPCCYMDAIPGFEFIKYDGSYDFFQAWNSPAMVSLRSRLKNGPLFSMCKRCPAQPQYVPAATGVVHSLRESQP